jgi:Glycosyl hydrolase family 14
MIRWLYLLTPCLAGSLTGAEIARWSADQPAAAGGIRLVRAADANWTMEAVAGTRVAAVTPVKDYYRRAAILLRVDKPVHQPAWLRLGYLDRGYGQVSVAVSGSKPVAASDQWGIARLNSGKLRHAIFRIGDPANGIRIEGVAELHDAVISDAEPAREPLPEVKPALALTNPMDLVVSSGADAATLDGLPDALANMRNLLPLAKALGFGGIESYVKWNFVERTPGNFDWSFYDALVDEIEKRDLKWFPLLIVGSAYALPEWFFKSPDMVGFRCLEHGIEIEIPTIFSDHQVKHVRRFLAEFGRHYRSRKVLLGVRLGPSANYGEAQYPATGAWGYRDRRLHTHLGYWAGDAYASESFRRFVQARYSSVADLNKAWDAEFKAFGEVKTFLPITAMTPRMRLDFANWYMGAMSEWCEKWAVWAREAMPETSIYQSSGGWGAVEIGTDYTAQAKSMARLKGGIRLTNENDSYRNNFGATRMAASAARFYGAKLGFEPAGFSSVRGVVGRIFNSLTNGADHLFYYHGNLYGNDQALDAWVKQGPLLNDRAQPVTEIAVFYPDSSNRVSDDVLRHLRASAFFQRVQAFRSVADYDYVSEQMVLDGALDRYKVLVFLWGRIAEKSVLDRIDGWVGSGGTVIYPEKQQAREGGLSTVEGDLSVWNRWRQGQTGRGRVILFEGHPEPVHYYITFLRNQLRDLEVLSTDVRAALGIEKPEEVYWSILKNQKLALLNYDDDPAVIKLTGGKTIRIPPYTIVLEQAGSARKE